MAYIPTVWQDGDVITAEKLNNGISSKILIAKITDINLINNELTGTCEYTFQELRNYIKSGYYVMFYSGATRGLTDLAELFSTSQEEDTIGAMKIMYPEDSFVLAEINYTEEGLTIKQNAISFN